MDNISYSKEDYNNEPVFYCKTCLSLNIRIVGEDTDYCEDCGSTAIDTTHIDVWEDLYATRYTNNQFK